MFLEFQCCMFECLTDYFALVTVMISLYFFPGCQLFFFFISVEESNQSKNSRTANAEELINLNKKEETINKMNSFK